MALSATSVGTDATHSTTGTLTISVSATGGAGRVIIIVGTETNTSTPATVSSVAGLSASWTKRAAVTFTTHGQSLEEWYADFGGTTSGTVTVTMSATIDDSVLLAVFVSSSTGAVISYDANGSLPGTLGNAGGGTVEVSASTNSTAPFVLLISGSLSAFPTSPTPISTLVNQAHNVGGVNSQYAQCYGASHAQLSSTTSGFGASTANSVTLIVDALTEPPAASSMFMVL